MNKVKNLAIKIAGPVSVALYAASAHAQLNIPTDTKVPQVNAVSDFNATKLITTISTLVNWVVALIGVASLVFLMYGAYMYMSAGQSEDNLKKAKASVMYGIIGAVVAILAFSIFTFAKSFIG